MTSCDAGKYILGLPGWQLHGLWIVAGAEFVIIDKPNGVTSREAMYSTLSSEKGKKGIEGILDPFATGVLILAYGPATRFLS